MTGTSGAERIRQEAEAICQGQGAEVVEVTPLSDGYAVEINVPKASGMTDAQWQAAVNDVRAKLQAVKGIKRVLLSTARA